MSRTLACLLVLLGAPSMAFAQSADLSVSVTPRYDVAGEVDLTLTVANAGPDDLLDLEILGMFDTDLARVVSLDPSCSASSVGVACSFTSLDEPVIAAGGERALELRLAAEAGAGDATFSASASVEDPDASNDEATVPLIRPTRVDVAVDERGIDAGERKTLVFSAENNGPDVAANVRVNGTVTVDFDGAKTQSEARELTGMTSDPSAVCGRQVPESAMAVARWTFAVSCSIADLQVGQLVEFEFWFEGGSNALFRMSAVSGNLDENPANDVTDGSFLNSPVEFVDTPEEGCCATASGRRAKSGGLVCAAMFSVGAWRRRGHSRT